MRLQFLSALFFLFATTPAYAAIEISSTAFSGSETIVTFAGEAATAVDSIASGGVTFSTTDNSSSLRLASDSSSGRTGPADATVIGNNASSLYPNVLVELPFLSNRFGLDLRTNTPDRNVSFTLFRNGSIIDFLTIESDAHVSVFDFYGFESVAQFDAVIIDVPNVAVGAFHADNIRFEATTAPVPEPTTWLVLSGLGLCFGAFGWYRGRRQSRN